MYVKCKGNCCKSKAFLDPFFSPLHVCVNLIGFYSVNVTLKGKCGANKLKTFSDEGCGKGGMCWAPCLAPSFTMEMQRGNWEPEFIAGWGVVGITYSPPK